MIKPMFPRIGNLKFEENQERLKVVLPLKRNWFLFVLFTLCLLVWLVGTGVMLVFLFRDVMFSGQRYTFVFTVMMLVWLYVWYRLGRILWGRWQYVTADREVLFINKERLIVRRPISLLGITDAYDMQHVTPFYYSEHRRCPAFDYARQRIDFGNTLSHDEGVRLVKYLNGRFFPHVEEDE